MGRILIVDDHPLVRTGFAQLIGDCPDLEVCGEASDMAEALQRIDQVSPDLAIIDLSLAGGSGLDLIEHIKSRDQNILMLVASMHDETLYAERVLAAGARGYINKQEAQDSIIRAIRQRRQKVTAPNPQANPPSSLHRRQTPTPIATAA